MAIKERGIRKRQYFINKKSAINFGVEPKDFAKLHKKMISDEGSLATFHGGIPMGSEIDDKWKRIFCPCFYVNDDDESFECEDHESVETCKSNHFDDAILETKNKKKTFLDKMIFSNNNVYYQIYNFIISILCIVSCYIYIFMAVFR